MGEIKFSEQAQQEYEKILSHYPVSKESALLPVLHLAQKEFGYISDEVMQYVAKLLDISPVKVKGVATFYTMYNKQPVGKYHLQVCHNISCVLNGSEELIEHIKQKLNIENGETTEDGLFTLTEVECLGACGEGPVIQVNDDYHLSMTKEKVDELIEKLRRGE